MSECELNKIFLLWLVFYQFKESLKLHKLDASLTAQLIFLQYSLPQLCTECISALERTTYFGFPFSSRGPNVSESCKQQLTHIITIYNQ